MKTFQNQQLIEALKAAQRIFLCTHVAPDGDAIGCLLAAKFILEGMGKSVVVCDADPVPLDFRILPGAGEIIRPDQVTGEFDTAMSLDAADFERIGASGPIFAKAPVRLQVDHHGTNPGYAMHNEVDADAPAAGCIVFRMLKALGQPLTESIAACLYTAISMDTGNFNFPSVDAETFEIMAELMKTGFDMSGYARQLHMMRQTEYLGMLSRALGRLQFLYDGKVTMMGVYPEDFAAVHALPEHSDGIVNYGLYIPGVRLTCFVNSQQADLTRFSFRALAPYSAQRIAVALGGGGHEAAAGATVYLPAREATEKALAAIDEEMKRHA